MAHLEKCMTDANLREMHIRYDLPLGFVPPGLVERMIARAHNLGPVAYWRHGALFNIGAVTVLIQGPEGGLDGAKSEGGGGLRAAALGGGEEAAGYSDTAIRLTAIGPHASGEGATVLTALWFNFTVLLSEFAGLKSCIIASLILPHSGGGVVALINSLLGRGGDGGGEVPFISVPLNAAIDHDLAAMNNTSRGAFAKLEADAPEW